MKSKHEYCEDYTKDEEYSKSPILSHYECSNVQGYCVDTIIQLYPLGVKGTEKSLFLFIGVYAVALDGSEATIS